MERKKAPLLHELATTETIRTPESDGHSQVVFVTGVTGVGKDFLINSTIQRFDPMFDLNMVNGGTELANELGVEKNDLAYRSAKDFVDDHKIILDKVKACQPAILNGHIWLKRDNAWMYDRNFLKELNAAYHVVLIGNPEQIVKNINKKKEDGIVVNESYDEEEIAEMQSNYLHVVDRWSKKQKSGMSVMYVNYDDKNVSLANAASLGKIIRDTLKA